MLMFSKRSSTRTESCIFFLCMLIFVHRAALIANPLCEKIQNFHTELQNIVNKNINNKFKVSNMIHHVIHVTPSCIHCQQSDGVKKVRRSNILKDSMKMIAESEYNELMVFLQIELLGEMNDVKSIIYPEIRIEWLILLCKEIFEPHSKYFQYIEDSEIYSIQFKSLNEITEEDEEFFQFVGKVVGLAIYYKIQIPAYFNKLFYAKILGKEIKLEDIKEIDSIEYDRLTQVKDPQETSSRALTTNDHVQGKSEKLLSLCGLRYHENVDNSKKDCIEYSEKFAPEKQTNAFLEGFHEIIPNDLLKRKEFTEEELDALICGVRKINMEDWKKNTRIACCSNCPSNNKTDLLQEWFWKIVENFNDKQKAVLLRYLTGVSRAPVCGFDEVLPKFLFYLKDIRDPPYYADIRDRMIAISIHYEKYSDLEEALKTLVNEEIESLHQYFGE